MTTLTFRNTLLETIPHNSQIWFTSSELAKALQYADSKAVAGLYNSNKDEFTTGMSLVVDSTKNGINNSLRKIKVRIFSLRGAHLIVIFARTPVAKEFRKWVLDILDKEVGNPQQQPEAPELLSNSDSRNLARLVWYIARGFRFERSWTNAVWFALCNVTGTSSPQRFEVQHIPLLAQECRRIYYIASQLQDIIQEAEKQVIRRLLRKREDSETVLSEMQQLFETSVQENISPLLKNLTTGMKAKSVTSCNATK